MKRINITIHEPLHARLKRISRKTGLSVSELFRRAADAMYGREKPPEKKQGEK